MREPSGTRRAENSEQGAPQSVRDSSFTLSLSFSHMLDRAQESRD